MVNRSLILAQPGSKVTYPIMADPDRSAIKQLNMVDPDEKDSEGQLPSRTLHIVGPDKKVKLTITYPASTGRNFQEVLRVIDSLQLTAKHSVATPADWKQGEDVIVVPAVSTEDAEKRFPKGLKIVKPYLRYTPQPDAQ
jgi:alkyl hydroperoxide reductase subunit AhpC